MMGKKHDTKGGIMSVIDLGIVTSVCKDCW